MRYTKRIAALVLALAMAIPLAACNGQEEETTAEITTVAANEADGATDETATEATGAAEQTQAGSSSSGGSSGTDIDTSDPNKIYDLEPDDNMPSDAFRASLKGTTVKILQPWYVEGSTSKIYRYYNDSETTLEKMYGVTIEEKQGTFSSYNSDVKAAIENKKTNEQVYQMQAFYFATFVKGGYMKSLTTAMRTAGVTFTEPWYIQEATAYGNINGNQYAWMSFDAEYAMPMLILYNTKFIKEKKLEDPAQLAKNGQWTWAKMEEYAKKLKTSSRVGFAGPSGAGAAQILSSMVASAGGSLVTVKRGQTAQTNIKSTVVIDCLSQLETWVKNGTMTFNKNESWQIGKEKFAKGQIAMMFASHDAIKENQSSTYAKNYVGIAPFPNKTASKTYNSVQCLDFMTISPNTVSDEEAAKILFIRDQLYRYNYRYRNVTFNYLYGNYNLDADGDADAINMARDLKYGLNGFNKTIDPSMILEYDASPSDAFPTLGTKIVTPVLSQEKTAAQAINENATALQASFNRTAESMKLTGRIG